ncbi:MAG: hypothetical protein ACJAVK_002316 [Akkermansiaceae bacterium]
MSVGGDHGEAEALVFLAGLANSALHGFEGNATAFGHLFLGEFFAVDFSKINHFLKLISRSDSMGLVLCQDFRRIKGAIVEPPVIDDREVKGY